MRRILDATDPFQIQGIIIDASLEFAQMIFALQTHSNINYWHWWIKFFQAWFHNNTLLNIPSGALHVDAMHTAAVPRCCAVITKRKEKKNSYNMYITYMKLISIILNCFPQSRGGLSLSQSLFGELLFAFYLTPNQNVRRFVVQPERTSGAT